MRNSSIRANTRLGASLVVILSITASRSHAQEPTGSLRALDAADLVRYATIDDPRTLSWNDRNPGGGVILSPDGKLAVVIVRGGNPEQATNEASLLLYRTRDLRRGMRDGRFAAKTLTRFASTGNYQPIALVRWLEDSRTIVFAGTQADGRSQIYRLDTRSGTTEALTQETEQLLSFDITPRGDRLVLLAEEPKRPPADDPECKARGCLVTAEKLWDAINGLSGGSATLTLQDLRPTARTVIANPEAAQPTIKRCDDTLHGDISPDGRYLLRRCALRELPASWQPVMSIPGMRDCWDWHNADYCDARALVITDLDAGTHSIVGTSPVRTRPDPLWIDHARSFVLAGVHTTESGAPTGQSPLGVVLFDTRTLSATRIAQLDPLIRQVSAAAWDKRTQTLTVEPRGVSADGVTTALPPQYFRRAGKRWKAVTARAARVRRPPVELVVEQSPNQRPILVAVDGRTGTRKTVLDPNPWLAERKLGKVEEVRWPAGGRTWSGGLYYPDDYIAGRRYPLLIQTNGYASDRFSLDGLSRNYAGRALAAHGIVVLQVDENYSDVAGTPAEWLAVKAGYEAAIEHLHLLGVIDRNRVGIQGWDRSGTHVGYLLAQSSLPIAASALTDSGDFGLWWYLSMGEPAAIDGLFGGAPYGDTLNSWFEKSPTFNMDRVRTPMFLWQSQGPIDLWDWYAGLRRLDKPVEYWIAPDAVHDVFQVEQRMTANQLVIDWFRFWLQGAEDGDAAKAEQYVRWREFRERQINSAAANAREHQPAP